MLSSLFARLTADRKRGAELFAGVVAEARREHWYVGGQVPDTVDGRFSVLATTTALVLVRLDRSDAAMPNTAAALTERFVESLDAELREMGLGDPAIGKQVRRLVGSLESRVGSWKEAIGGSTNWGNAVLSSMYRGNPPAAEAFEHSRAATHELWQRLKHIPDEALAEGRIG